MSLAVVYSRGRCGITAPLVTVEVHISNGLPALNIVGLPEAAVKSAVSGGGPGGCDAGAADRFHAAPGPVPRPCGDTGAG